MDEKTNENKEQKVSPGTTIIQRVIEDEMKQSYLDYSMSVIVGRALPDARDGLKPVHRRVLYTMLESGLLHNKAFRKSANVVGNCMAKFHPHGDMSIYDTLVRLAQDFSMRYLLVDGQGNFGSVDGDNAAAMRYCVTGESLVVTEKGLMRIDEISDKEDINIKLLSKDKKVNIASKWFDSNGHSTLKLITNNGYSLSGSYNHPVLILNKDETGKPTFIWKLLENIKEGDFVVIDRSTDTFWPKEKIELSKYYPNIKRTTKLRILPKFLEENLAFILGSFVSEGTLTKNKIEFCNTDEKWINNLLETWNIVFPDSTLHRFKKIPSSYGKKEYFRLECHCRYTLEFLRNIGLKCLKSSERLIPKLILQSSKEIVKSFLKTYFEGDGSISYSRKMIELSCCSKSEKLINEIQIIMLRFGIDSFKRFDKYRLTWKLYLRGYRNVLRFYKELGFISDYKNKKLEYIVYNYKKDSSLFDYVPFISDYVRSKTHSEFVTKNNFDRYTNMGKNYEEISSILLNETGQDYNQMFEYFLTYNYLFDKVIKVEEMGIQRVYSLKVESKCHSFISNGFISHNTEARLSKLSEEMLQDIDKKTVKFIPNFDNSALEPTVLPAKVPNLLVNGSSGIAVGMATNIPPHNMPEIVDGIINQIDNPDISIDKLMQNINGPDFPTGATICGRNGIIEAYKTGRGKIIVRANSQVEDIKDKKRIIITEIPYMVNKAEMITQIADRVRDKKIIGISDIRDESDRNGIRIVIELKKDTNPDVLLNQLYIHSRLQVTFGIIMVALVNNVPKVLNLSQLIQYYIDHRKDIVKKRTYFDLNKAQKRAHILEGLIVALNNLDKTIKLVKESKSIDEAKNQLINNFNLSAEQSIAILEMRLQRLTSLEQDKIKKEHEDLLKLIIELKVILNSPKKILDIIKEELIELKKNYGDKRKTEILETEATSFEMEDILEESNCVITITHSGYIKRQPLQTYRQQKRGGKGLIATTTKDEDFVRDIFIASTHSFILLFTNKGKVHWVKVYDIPEASRQARGKAIVNLVSLQSEEKVTAYIPIKTFDPNKFLIMATKNGTIKKTSLDSYSNPRRGGIVAITLDPNDSLINVKLTDGNKEIIIATRNGSAVRFNETNVRPTGRSSQGVRGIKLSSDDFVVGMVVATNDKTLLTVTENGYGKRSQISEYRLISRGGSGVRNIICSDRNGKVVSINSVSEDNQLMLITKNGITIRMPVSQIKVIGRSTQGVRLINLHQNDKLVSVAKIIKE